MTEHTTDHDWLGEKMMDNAMADIQADDIKHGLYDATQMTREELEWALVNDDIAFILDNAHDTEFLAITLLDGFKGYRNMPILDLIDDYNGRELSTKED
jgi:predicted protein tyrosine phosphatase